MKRSTVMLALVASVFMATAHAQGSDVIRMGVEGAFPPFNEMGTDGQPHGFDVDIGNALCVQLKTKCEWVVQNWDGMIPALMSNKFDAIMSSMTDTAERREKISFTEKYYSVASRMVARSGSSFDPTRPETLKGKKVGMQRSSPHESFAKAVLAPAGAKVVTYPSDEDALTDLASGRLDAVMGDSTMLATGFLNQPQGTGFAFTGKPVTNSQYFGAGIAIGVRKDDSQLRDRLNSAINAIRASGEYYRIAKRYFNFDIYSGI
ncbi:ABC transporter substrate-binding protein [Paraburkholderia youngii]|uniref:ABC transporter substrate-binding protein n=1 Tax=Paraburkholderia youngii TaxID=2782701 RepID=A0A7Y6K752_9BURK|nr:ABC transporter substrate-binding protein [Paraburkholderia youngii]NUY05517.1 ABC transporter substrate-binding protein [Paraburkholderia youngii]